MIKVTVIQYNGTTTDSIPTNDFKLLRNIGMFTKSSGTTVQVTWTSHAFVRPNFDPQQVQVICAFQIRVDGNQAIPGSTEHGAVVFASITGLNFAPVSTTHVFTGLAAGLHTVSLWERTNGTPPGASQCGENPGNFTRLATVTEF